MNNAPIPFNDGVLRMKERPILFNSEMVRAILENRKSQTRRVIKPQPEVRRTSGKGTEHALIAIGKCPLGQTGDRLWVRETWRTEELEGCGTDGVRFQADDSFQIIENSREASDRWLEAHCGNGTNPCRVSRWRPSIHMPRWASRITLEVTDVRVERVQDISWEDSISEGIKRLSSIGPLRAKGWKDYGDGPGFMVPTTSFRTLWDSINASRGFGWEENPWVWVVEFRKLIGDDS